MTCPHTPLEIRRDTCTVDDLDIFGLGHPPYPSGMSAKPYVQQWEVPTLTHYYVAGIKVDKEAYEAAISECLEMCKEQA